MSEEQIKSLNNWENEIVIDDAKTLTADQRTKVIRLCENVIKNAEGCLKEIGGNKEDVQCSNCQYSLAKQLLEEFKNG